MGKKIPYGISSFEQIRNDNYLYVDKTRYIEILENDAPYQFFIRPRRFGKSLFISMLECYYDINKKDDFESLFRDLYISENLTDKRNSYLVLKINFSSVVSSQGKERLIESFDESVIKAVKSFFTQKYYDIFQKDNIDKEFNNAIDALRYLNYEALSKKASVFVLIDEYDNFANDLISVDKSLYYDIISSHGYVRTFYKMLKEATSDTVKRIFMTGVSPIMLDDLTSGFNITTNLTLELRYNEILGFTEEELRLLIENYTLPNNLEVEHIIKDLKQYYNGYLFSKRGGNRLYNTNMVLYFLRLMLLQGSYPDNILDENIKTDYEKIRLLAFNFKNDELIEKLLTTGTVESTIVERFNLEHMYDKKENFASILYYMGMLTIKKGLPRKAILTIPNYVIKTIYWEYFLDKLIDNDGIKDKNEHLYEAVDTMAVNGDITKFHSYLSEILAFLSNRDLSKFDEKYIKLLIMSKIYENGYYIINSEYEVESGYIDLLLSKNRAYEDYIKYEWLIELKYIKENDRRQLEQVKKEGMEQLLRYSKSSKLSSNYNLDNMKKVLIIVVGKKDVYVEMI